MWRLYLRPFWSKVISLFEKGMFVLLIILGWKVCFSCGVIVCTIVNFLNFLSNKCNFFLNYVFPIKQSFLNDFFF